VGPDRLYMHAVYCLSTFIDTQASRVRAEGGIDASQVGSHTNISICIAINFLYVCHFRLDRSRASTVEYQ
jgi:hypothetical protein